MAKKKKRGYFLLKYISEPVFSYFYLSDGVESVLLLSTRVFFFPYFYLSTGCEYFCHKIFFENCHAGEIRTWISLYLYLQTQANTGDLKTVRGFQNTSTCRRPCKTSTRTHLLRANQSKPHPEFHSVKRILYVKNNNKQNTMCRECNIYTSTASRFLSGVVLILLLPWPPTHKELIIQLISHHLLLSELLKVCVSAESQHSGEQGTDTGRRKSLTVVPTTWTKYLPKYDRNIQHTWGQSVCRKSVWSLCHRKWEGNAAQTWAEGEDYGRKKLFVALFHNDVMSAPLSCRSTIILNKPLGPQSSGVRCCRTWCSPDTE